jgi:sugar O-acyltransferase (sialic acid O-acetyltransferase NeuD family)
MKRLAIMGASGHGKVVADIAELCDWQVEFFDDAWPKIRKNGDWKVVGNTETLLSQLARYNGMIVAIGDNTIRYKKLQELKDIGAPLVTLVHPGATVSQYTVMGAGSVVMAGVVVNVGATIGDGAILNTGCCVDHDCILGDSVHISVGARLAGKVCVGDKSWVGIGASVRQGINIGSNVIVGAGAAVVSHLPNDVTAVGVPARY